MYFVQITDTHVCVDGRKAYGQVDTNDGLKQSIKAINALDPKPDFVVVTGDLVGDYVEIGVTDEYDVFREIMDELTIPYYVLPGNHDSRDMMAKTFQDHDYLFQYDDDFLHYTIDDQPMRIIGLDSKANQKVNGKMSHGELCQERLDWLRARLEEDKDTPTLIMVHHPPFETGIVSMDGSRLLQEQELADVLDEYPNVKKVICGHVHRHIFGQVGNTPATIAPATTHSTICDFNAASAKYGFTKDPASFMAWRYNDTRKNIVGHQIFVEPSPQYDWGSPEQHIQDTLKKSGIKK